MTHASEGGLQFLQSNPIGLTQKLLTPQTQIRSISTLARGHTVANVVRVQGIGNRFVYVLRSDVNPARHYVGTTSDVDQRLEWHNHGPCGYTVRHRPWSVLVVLSFPPNVKRLASSAIYNQLPAERLRSAISRRGMRSSSKSLCLGLSASGWCPESLWWRSAHPERSHSLAKCGVGRLRVRIPMTRSRP
jgi:predicted GIY-YIG superfamily endonuclease